MANQIVELRPTGRATLVLSTAPFSLGLDTDWGDVASDPSLAEGPEIIGAVVGTRRRPVAERSLEVWIKEELAEDYIDAALTLMNAATALQDFGGTVSRQLEFEDGTLSEELECEVLSAQITEAEDGWLEVNRTTTLVVVSLTTQPNWLAEWETAGSTLNSTASLIEVPILPLRGNLPGPGRVTISDDAATARRFVELGGAFTDYDASAEVEFRAAAFSLTGTDGALATDADAIGPGSNNVVAVTPVLPVWRTAAYLIALPHRGSFRNRIRAKFDTDEVTGWLRVVWRSGQGGWKELGTVEVPSGGFYDLDVGTLHHYDPAETIELRFDVRSSAVEATITFRLNLTTITPSEVYAVVRGLSVPLPPTGVAAFDVFDEAVAGDEFNDPRTASLGGDWSLAAGTPDFVYGPPTYAWHDGFFREGANDTSLQAGALALLGAATTYHTVVISGLIYHQGDHATDTWLLGLIHYVDATHWVAAGLRIRRRTEGNYEGYVCLYKRDAGAPDLLKQKRAKNTALRRAADGQWLYGSVQATIAASGNYEVHTGSDYLSPNADTFAFKGTDADFATSGSHDDGKIGVLSSIDSTNLHASTILTGIAAFDEVTESTAVDVVRSGGLGQIDYSQAVSADDGVVDPQPVSFYQGRRLWLPPGLTGQLTAKVRSGDSEEELDTGAALQTDVLVEHRPAFASLSDVLGEAALEELLIL